MAQKLATPTREQADAAIRETARNYIEGWADGDPAGMELELALGHRQCPVGVAAEDRDTLSSTDVSEKPPRF